MGKIKDVKRPNPQTERNGYRFYRNHVGQLSTKETGIHTAVQMHDKTTYIKDPRTGAMVRAEKYLAKLMKENQDVKAAAGEGLRDAGPGSGGTAASGAGADQKDQQVHQSPDSGESGIAGAEGGPPEAERGEQAPESGVAEGRAQGVPRQDAGT